MVSAAATSAGDTLVYDMFAPGGYTLDQHFQNTLVVNKIKAGDWDFVVLQEQSQKPAFPQYSFSASVVLSNMIRQYNPCARPLFYRTWGRKNGDTPNCSFWPPLCTYLGMDSMLHLRYLAMAQINHAEVSPVGQVWKAIRQQFPSIELYNADESHPSVAGSYAAACSFYTSIFKKNPLSITYNSSIPIANAISIRQMAKLVVFDSLSKWHFPDQTPLALFTYFAGTQPNSIRFFNHSERAAAYFWSFGDGDTSTQASPVHTFPANGTYTVTLTVTRCDLDTVYEHKIQKVIQFCDFTPTITPDTIMLCSVNPDTLQTQNFESYQWFNDNGDSIPGANSRFYIPVSSGWHHVQATQNGCTEVSEPAFVNAMTSFNFYYVGKEGVADSLCDRHRSAGFKTGNLTASGRSGCAVVCGWKSNPVFCERQPPGYSYR